MRRYIRRNILLVLVILGIMATVIYAADNGYASSNHTKLDAVLVIDASGSMQETDPNKLGLEGVKLFVDMLSSTGNQAGVVTYGAEADQVYPMTQITDTDDREALKRFVNGISRNLEYTDITSGLDKAVSMLDERDMSYGGSPVIIVFTDGNNAIGGLKNRTKADIDKALANDIAKAQAGGYPVYTIGLNDNGKLNEAYLKNISDKTGGMAFATKDPDELPVILTKIFAAHSNLKVQSMPTLSASGDFQEVKVNIPNDNVLEANIAVTSAQKAVFKLADPSGTAVNIPSQNVSLHESNAYHLIKITKPLEGDWTLYVKGVSGDRINISLVYNYDMDVVMEPLSSDSFHQGDMLDVSAYLSLQGSPVNDDALYQSAAATVIVTDAGGNESRAPLIANGQKFEGSIKLVQQGNLNVSVLVEDSSYTRQSVPTAIIVEKGGAESRLPGNDKETGKEKSTLPYLVGFSLFLAAAIALAVILKKVKEAKRPLTGQIVLEITDHTTGKLTPPQYKKLNVFPGKVSLLALLQFAPEYKEAEKIFFRSAPHDKVLMFNHSGYVVEKSGRAVKMENGLELRKGDKLSINMADSGVTIQLEYLL